MPKVWNIGNTTVRNPKRIEKALDVFLNEGFSGNAKGQEIEARIHLKLKENEVLEFEGEPSDFNGRKWRAAFYQLGFISFERYKVSADVLKVPDLFDKIGLSEITRPYQITPAGRNLLAATAADNVPQIEEIYTRQFACYELPNSLESSFPEGKMKPFILLLQVLSILKNRGQDGITKFETGLFLQKFRNHTPTLAHEIAQEIEEYRKSLLALKTSKEIKELRIKHLEMLAEFSEIDPQSIVRDYADTTFRYFSLSGLFTRIGDTLIIRPSRQVFVDKMLSIETNFVYANDPLKYFYYFYTNQYPLPIDEIEFVIDDIKKLSLNIRDSKNTILDLVNKLGNSSLEEISEMRYKLLEYNNRQREEDFAAEQKSESSIKNIITFLKTINNEPTEDTPFIEDRPAYFEWAVWRAFLAINDIVGEAHNCRRFQVDEDFNPRNTAPGRGADLIFEFEGYVLIVEVTLTTSHRQMAVESEPVRRHTVQYVEQYPGKDIYCLFIAPEVDNNVAETFRIGVWYKQDEEAYVNIVPMTLKDFITSFETILRKRFTNSEYRNLLDRCLSFRNSRAPLWKKNISREVTNWSSRVAPH